MPLTRGFTSVGPAGCAAPWGGFRRGNRQLQYRNSRQSTNESDTQLDLCGPGADLIAPRRPLGQDMLALGLNAEGTRRNANIHPRSRKTMSKNSEIDPKIHRKSDKIQDQVDPKWSQNEAKRDTKPALGGLRRPISRLLGAENRRKTEKKKT